MLIRLRLYSLNGLRCYLSQCVLEEYWQLDTLSLIYRSTLGITTAAIHMSRMFVWHISLLSLYLLKI